MTTQDWNYYDIHENGKVYPNQVMATISHSLYRNVRTGCSKTFASSSEKTIWIIIEDWPLEEELSLGEVI